MKTAQIVEKDKQQKQKQPIVLGAFETHETELKYANTALYTNDRSLALTCADYSMTGQANSDLSPSAERRDEHCNTRGDFVQINDT